MYLTDYREETLFDVITQLEPRLFKKVTGLDVKDFNLLVSLGVFNSGLMNDAVYKFRRYEDASLIYTGINRHEGERHGLFDTTLSDYVYMEAAHLESMVEPDGSAKKKASAAKPVVSKSPPPTAKKAAIKPSNPTTQKYTAASTKVTASVVERVRDSEAKQVAAPDGDWVLEALQEAGLRYTDRRPQTGSLWVYGSKLISARLQPLIEHGAKFKLKMGGGNATKGKDAWWMSGYPERVEPSAEVDTETVSQAQLDAIDAGDRVFHKAFGYGEVQGFTSAGIQVAFNGEAGKVRTFAFPSAFHQGLLHL